MLAWVRTGIALMAFGFAIARFGLFLRQIAAVRVEAAPPEGAIGSGYVGVILVAAGMATSLLGTLRYHSVRRAVERGDSGPPSAALVYALGAVATVLGLIMTALLLHSLAR